MTIQMQLSHLEGGIPNWEPTAYFPSACSGKINLFLYSTVLQNEKDILPFESMQFPHFIYQYTQSVYKIMHEYLCESIYATPQKIHV